MRIEEIDILHEPTLKEVMDMNTDFIIDVKDVKAIYTKTKLMYDIIYPMRTILNRAKYNMSLRQYEKDLLKKMVEHEIDMFFEYF